MPLVEPKVEKKVPQNKITHFTFKNSQYIPIKNTYRISQITKPHQALGTLWILKNIEMEH